MTVKKPVSFNQNIDYKDTGFFIANLRFYLNELINQCHYKQYI